MESLLMALRSKEGQFHLIVLALGIVVACVGGYLLRNSSVLCDIVVVAGSVISMIGAEQFCRLIIQYRGDDGDK